MTQEEIREIAKNRGKQVGQISTAAEQKERMTFLFSESLFSSLNDDMGAGASRYFAGVRRLLSADKYARHCQNFVNPLPEMLAEIIAALSTSVQAVDKLVVCEFRTTESQESFNEISEVIETYFREHAIRQSLFSPSQILIIDSDEGRAKIFAPPPAQIFAFRLDDTGNFQMLAVKLEKTIAVYCDEHYRVYDIKDTQLQSPISEAVHGIGFCPACFLWRTPLSSESSLPRSTPASAAANKMENFLTHATGEQNLGLYAKYPIVTRVREKCTVLKFGKRCDGEKFEYMVDGEFCTEKCSCNSSSSIGPGTEISVTLADGQASLPTLVSVIGADVDTLEFNAKVTEDYTNSIFRILCGGNPEGFNNKAVNEKQVSGIFEAKRNLIKLFARTFEHAHEFLLGAAGRVMFADFNKCVVDYGKVFIIESSEYLAQALKEAKETGSGAGKILSLTDQIRRNEAKTETEFNRMQILDLLCVYNIPPADLLPLFTAQVIDRETLLFQLQFSSLVARYEREIGRITGTENIESLKSQLKSFMNYGKEGIRTDNAITPPND